MKVLVTGCAGFIGYHLCLGLLANQENLVVGIDNLNAYYDVNLKLSRLAFLKSQQHFEFIKMDLIDREGMTCLFQEGQFDVVVHLAAQAGVRYSLSNPHVYIESNVLGFLHILEGCRYHRVKHLVFASSSSVYGANTKIPFSVHDHVDHPISLYAATKKSNELMAHSYSYLYGLPCTGLRFFTVYGPWGRPDMALFQFTKAILNEEPIDVYNFGEMQRDFTYVDDVVECIIKILPQAAVPNPLWLGDTPDPSTSSAPYKIYNIGNNHPVTLLNFIEALENALGKKARKNLVPMQPGDVPITYADVADLMRDMNYKPNTPVTVGIQKFVAWYREYYG